ncbi:MULTISPECIES: DHA2 family efflux MFS transporter permease subunit [Gordonibacter]|uniref:DHA2 family efflux MFS transporter permease subunit n=2 Tax=Eggerthellaceae TaxID=1643826 RepID=A0ABT7DLV9_9ACTN|nr:MULTISPECIES: DHA2 family efflux MFS transporter permease subunit [unclassified Gordonibacter]MDJ1650392.1 DHA2 family efflux MFS transporter permease subunit [Gordonibacter sp. KGMB12511]
MRGFVRSERGQVYALFVIVMFASAFGNLSQTAVNAMLPEIMEEFAFDVGLGQWLTTSYMLVLGITVPVSTYLSKRFSTRVHVLVGLAFFLVGALADCLASSFAVLLAGRVCQAVSTGLLLPLMQTIAMTRFPEGRRATAMGVAGIAMGFAPNIGPTIGGALSFSLGWRSFFVLLVVGAALLAVVTVLMVRGGVSNPSERFDARSFTLSALGFGGLLLGFSEASSFALSSPFVWGPLVLGTLFLVLFVRRQKRVADPLIDMRIFASGQYSVGFVVLCLLHASFMGVTLVIPLYVEGLCGGTALDAGIVLLPGTIAALFLNPLAGALTDRFGVRPVTLVSGTLLAVGSVSMVFLDESTPLAVTTLCQAVRGFGVSGLMGPLISWSLAGLPGRLVTDGSSFSIAGRQAAASLGTSAMVLLIAVVGASSAATAVPALPYQLAFAFSAVFAVATFAFIAAKVR